MVDCKENYKFDLRVTGLSARELKHITNNGACQTSFFFFFLNFLFRKEGGEGWMRGS